MISGHSASKRVLREVKNSLTPSDASRVIISDPVLRQSEAKIIVENTECFEISNLVRRLPADVRIYVREVPFGTQQQVVSKFEIVFPVETKVSWFKILLFFWTPPLVVLFLYF